MKSHPAVPPGLTLLRPLFTYFYTPTLVNEASLSVSPTAISARPPMPIPSARPYRTFTNGGSLQLPKHSYLRIFNSFLY